jgi:glutamate-1-semialdehyde 2,1-aminomutase
MNSQDPTGTGRVFERSQELGARFHNAIPGGSHTYAKGDDQFPEHCAPYIVSGKGCRVRDADGNEFIEYGMGLRSVTLGHAYPGVVDAACRQMQLGSNFVRPATIELECAEEFLTMIGGAEMVKFGKNGSDATSAAVKLSRAFTGRDIVAICAEHPFFSVDDWFIGTTAMSAGIPKAIQDLTVKFHFNDPGSLRQLFRTYPGRIACVILEVEKEIPPDRGFLKDLPDICHEHGAVLILDEIITGFRWHNGGGQALYGITPDLSTFGKGIANGFSVSALAGKKEIMEPGGIRNARERVFLLSLTHGGETHSLAAALATMRTYQSEPVIETLWSRGERLMRGLKQSICEHRLEENVLLLGKPCCCVYGTRDGEKCPSQEFRTLFLQETITRGILAPNFVVSYSHTEGDIDRTVECVHEALNVYRKALDEGIGKYLKGHPVRPVFRRFSQKTQ